jgi:gliding motility-associated protein GldM
MAGGNPARQKMINMMYLVLTALLALNVSSEILKAFELVNGSLTSTNANFASKTTETMTQFQKLYENDKTKAEKLWAAAQQAVKESEAMVKYIDGLKEDIAKEAGGWKVESESDPKIAVAKPDDLDISSRYFVKNQQNTQKGPELRQKLIEFENKMKGFLINEKGEKVNGPTIRLDTDEKKMNNEKKEVAWEVYYFAGIPVIAAITELTQFQNNVRNVEADVVTFLKNQIGADDVKFDNFATIIAPERPAVYTGEKFRAEIFLGAYSSTQQPIIRVDGRELPVKDGKAVFEETSGGIGDKEHKVVVSYKDAKGALVDLAPAKMTYSVFGGNATISHTGLKVVYKGVDNPFQIAVPGFEARNISVSTNPSRIRSLGKPGEYAIKPMPADQDIKINVSVKLPDGAVKSVGGEVYKARPIPNPEISFNPAVGPQSAVPRGQLRVFTLLYAKLGQSFVFADLDKYQVQGYSVLVVSKGSAKAPEQITCQGPALAPRAKAAFNEAKAGDLVVISEVKVKGPDGVTKILAGPTFSVK